MKINETNLKFTSGLKNRSQTKRVIIHHTASQDVSAATIHGWHLNQGWAGIGYHLVIRANGDIERGRPEHTIGSHAGANGNTDSIGVVLTGNFETDRPTEAQMNSLVWLLQSYLFTKYGTLQVIGHKDVIATACPGKNFPWNELRKRMEVTAVEQWKLDIIENAKVAGIITSDHNPDETATKWFVLAVALNLLKTLGK